MKKEEAIKLLETYGRAWETQDPELIVSIFTDDATYDDPKEEVSSGREAIRVYWKKKVVLEQKDIKFNLLNVWVDGETVIAEWFATFIDVPRNVRIELTEVAVFTVKDGLFSGLREYYKSIKKPL